MSLISNVLTKQITLFQSSPVLKSVSRSFVTSAIRKKNDLMNLEPIEIATGMYKRDILDRLSKDNDPFSVKTLNHGPGSKEDPNMIPSAFESRMVGCICEEDSDKIVWMWLHAGEAKRCQCGFYFKLFYQEPAIIDKDSLTFT